MMDQGPKVGETAPTFDLESLGGGTVRVGGRNGRASCSFPRPPARC